MIFPSEARLSEKGSRQPKCVKPKMRVRKLKVVQIGMRRSSEKS